MALGGRQSGDSLHVGAVPMKKKTGRSIRGKERLEKCVLIKKLRHSEPDAIHGPQCVKKPSKKRFSL